MVRLFANNQREQKPEDDENNDAAGVPPSSKPLWAGLEGVGRRAESSGQNCDERQQERIAHYIVRSDNR